MPIVFGLAAVAAVFFFLSRSRPGGVPKVWVPVYYSAGGHEPGVWAEWHATDDQTRLFGPRQPSYWSRDGYFVFGAPGGGHFKPDWQVPIKYFPGDKPPSK